MAKIEIEIDLDDLASELMYFQYEDLIGFVLGLEAYVADSNFTESLIHELQRVLDEENS